MVTMSDIAERAGVARPTVSLVLNNRADDLGIKQETRDKIFLAAKELGYRRNELARQVKTGKSFTLGFLAGAAHMEYGARAFSGALDEADALGYTMKRFKFDDRVKDLQVLERCVEHRLAGVIINDFGPGFMFDEMRAEFSRHNLPFVTCDNKVPLPFGAQVRSDDEGGAYEATRHLIQLGHQKIAFLGGIENVGSAVPRSAGYRRAMEESGLGKYVSENWTDWENEKSCAAVREMAGKGKGYTAFVSASDGTALTSILTLRAMGLRVPQDVSVSGFGNVALTALVDPPLTTVAVDFEGMGKAAVDLLLQSPGDGSEVVEKIVSTQLIVRESTVPVS